MIIMVSMGFKSFGISFKWILLFGVVSLYIKYELSKRGIIKNETKLQNIPYTKKTAPGGTQQDKKTKTKKTAPGATSKTEKKPKTKSGTKQQN